MRVVVVGAGAIGSLFGGCLADQHEVVLIGRRPHVDAIRSQGLRLTGQTERRVKVKASTTCENLEVADVVLITTKAHDTAGAVTTARPVIGETTFVVSLQNGLGNIETIQGQVGPERTIGASTSHGCIFQGPGHVEHTGLGDTVLGPPVPPDLPAHHELADALTQAGLETEVVPDISEELWAKAAVNAAINPLTAITGLPNGALLDIPRLTRLMADVAGEVETVARARGLDVEEGAWVEKAAQVADRTATNRSSMLQDVQNGKRTEIDAICGQIAALADQVGVDAAQNRALHALVTGIEATLTYDG